MLQTVKTIHWKVLSLLCPALFISLMAFGVVPALVGDSADSWQLLPGVRVGPITAKMSQTDLIRLFGKENVRTKEVSIGERDHAPGTIVYPEEPNKTLVVLWKDSKARRFPKLVQISGEKSAWKLTQGISLGTTLKELERLNGKPFILIGLGGGEYAGTVVSWEQGKLENDFTEQGGVVLRLNDLTREDPAGKEDDVAVRGDHDFRSDHPLMQKINPTVYEIIFKFK